MSYTPCVLFITLCPQVDRLITELKLPPVDAYFKLRHVIEEVNTLLGGFSSNNVRYHLNPVKGNVAFSAAESGWSFTLESFARLYCEVHGVAMDAG